eukprot:Gb_09412 [translate_table: standard]
MWPFATVALKVGLVNLQVSCIMDSCQLLIHTYGPLRTRWVPALFGLARRRHQCLSFVVQNAERLAEWKGALAKQGCYAKTVPVFAETEVSTTDAVNLVSDTGRYLQQSKFLLVILNPCSGHGRARKIYYDKVEPIFKVGSILLCLMLPLATFNCIECNLPAFALKITLPLPSKVLVHRHMEVSPIFYQIVGKITFKSFESKFAPIHYKGKFFLDNKDHEGVIADFDECWMKEPPSNTRH